MYAGPHINLNWNSQNFSQAVYFLMRTVCTHTGPFWIRQGTPALIHEKHLIKKINTKFWNCS
uniref:Uncharacterized protein n=1 Tax=Anguilla anguilla TaxID=7936 RepID=A0A0E9TIW1_ANGAN